MQNWKIEIDEWKKVSKDMVEFFFKQSEKKLEETIKTFESSSRKTNQILSISITLVTIGLGYFVKFKEENLYLNIMAFLLAIIGTVIIFVLYKNLFFDTIGVKGSQPKEIIKEKFLTPKLSDEEQYINILLNECEKYQERINTNIEVNKKRNRRIKKVKYLFLFIPISAIFVKIIIYFLI